MTLRYSWKVGQDNFQIYFSGNKIFLKFKARSICRKLRERENSMGLEVRQMYEPKMKMLFY